MSDTTPPERVKVVFAQNGNIRLFTTGDIPASLADLPVYEYVRSDCNADCVSGLDCDALIKQAVADAVIASEARAAAAERELNELRAAQQWQPIETAPHEELVLLGWEQEWPDRRWKMELGLASAGERLSNGYSNRWAHGHATHWQPLPSPARCAARMKG